MYRYTVSAITIMDAVIKDETLGADSACAIAQHFKSLGCRDIVIKRNHDGYIPTELELSQEIKAELDYRQNDR